MDARVQAVFARARRDIGDDRTRALYLKRASDLRGRLFKQQLDLIQDPWRFKAALCTRRAGKSTSAITYMLITCLEKPGANVQYVTLTGKKARKEIWPDLKRTCRRYDLDATFNEQLMTCAFANGSVINLDGCEDKSEIEKYRGSDGGYDLFVIDECKSFDADMFRELLDECVIPALDDRMGTLLIIGTPGRFLSGPFYEVTSARGQEIERKEDEETGREYQFAKALPFGATPVEGVEYYWSFHKWATRDNVAMPHIWKGQLATKRKNGWSSDDPIWRREYQAEWVADDSGYVYRYLAERNDWTDEEDSDNDWGLPSGHDWRILLGCDLGYDDDFAIVIAAWAETHPTFYFIDEFSQAGLLPHQWAEHIELMIDKYGEIDAMVGDRGALGKAILLEMDELYGLQIDAAEKSEKRDFQELLNSDLMSKRVLLRKGMRLGRQMSMLQWKDDGKTEDKESSAKDLCDSALYVWRYAYHHYSKPKAPVVQENSNEAIRAAVSKHEARLQERARRRAQADHEDEPEDRRGSWDGMNDMEGWD